MQESRNTTQALQCDYDRLHASQRWKPGISPLFLACSQLYVWTLGTPGALQDFQGSSVSVPFLRTLLTRLTPIISTPNWHHCLRFNCVLIYLLFWQMMCDQGFPSPHSVKFWLRLDQDQFFRYSSCRELPAMAVRKSSSVLAKGPRSSSTPTAVLQVSMAVRLQDCGSLGLSHGQRGSNESGRALHSTRNLCYHWELCCHWDPALLEETHFGLSHALIYFLISQTAKVANIIDYFHHFYANF